MRSLRAVSLVALVVTALPVSAHALDTWTQVASGGLGDASRTQVDAMILRDDYLYVASAAPLPLGGKQPYLFRALVAHDTAWSDHSPSWEAAGQVVGMRARGLLLFVATSNGNLWRLNADDSWTELLVPGSGEALALEQFTSVRGVSYLCLLRHGLELWCTSDPDGDEGYFLLSAVRDADILSASTASSRAALFLGLGGGSEGSLTCQAWRLDLSDFDLSPLSTNCFGHPDITWISSMIHFDRYTYFGTGGHGEVVLLRAGPAGGIEDVTPRALYGTAPLPIRYGSMAISSGRLYVGTRTPASFPVAFDGAEVLVSSSGVFWERSSDRAFGIAGNDAVSALAGDDAWLYAGTVNPPSGFQIWRRQPLLPDVLPPSFEDLHVMVEIGAHLNECLLPPPLPCAPDFGPMFERLEEIRLRFLRVGHPDTQLLESVGLLLEDAAQSLGEASALAAQAEKAETLAAAQILLSSAQLELKEGVLLTREALFLARDALREELPQLDAPLLDDL